MNWEVGHKKDRVSKNPRNCQVWATKCMVMFDPWFMKLISMKPFWMKLREFLLGVLFLTHPSCVKRVQIATTDLCGITGGIPWKGATMRLAVVISLYGEYVGGKWYFLNFPKMDTMTWHGHPKVARSMVVDELGMLKAAIGSPNFIHKNFS